MRMHLGFSFNIKNILKYIIVGVLGLLAFLGISQVNAETISPTEISATNGYSNIIYCDSNLSNYCPSTFNSYIPPYTEYAGIKYINIDYGNNSLTSGHSYTFDIVFVVARPVSLNDFEQESLTFWQYSGYQLNDTTITWTETSTYEQQTGIYYSYFHFRGQFTPNSTSAFYVRLTLEQYESVYGINVLSSQIVDDNSNDELIESNYQNTQNIINNANNNTNDIINNNDNNTQQIIDNQTELLGNKCNNVFNPTIMNGYYGGAYYTVDSNGLITQTASDAALWPSATSRIFTLPSGTYTFHIIGKSSSQVFQVYNYNTSSSIFESSGNSFTYTFNENTRLGMKTYGGGYPNSYYIMINEGSTSSSYCKYGSFTSKLDNVSNSVNDLNDTITDSSIDLDSGSDFFDDFEDENFGLSGVITAPLVAIRTLNNGSNCSDLSFVVLGKSVSFPSGCVLWSRVPSATETIYFVIVCGFLSYILVTRLFHTINSLKDPNKSEVKTLDL